MGEINDPSAQNRTFMRTSAGAGLTGEPLVAGTRLGAWAVEAPIASGGMGQVYRARRADGAYEQSVAIKLIHDRQPERVERFAAERQRLAEMDHPGIARIIDGGTHADGRPWMAMELVEGAPIMPQAMSLPRERRLRLFADLCAAVAHAHGRLVLHRDLKSANVLLDASGAVRLVDFGISALAESEVAPGSAYTPATAAPEQMRGEAPSVQTDVFALGCILHELLTGAVPGRDGEQDAIVDRAGLGDADLQAIVARATARVPADRYPSVDALADDVLAVLEHRPVAARHGGAGYRVGKFVRRFPVASGLAAAFVAALIGGILVSLNYARAAEAEAARAQTELARAEFFLERNDVVNRAREAYADALQAMFASDADVERLTALLKARWQDAHANRAANPTQAASLSYSIGRHFLFRNDYVTALEILEPWVTEGYGPPGLLQQGRRTIAYAYQYTGRREEAEALFRQALAEIEAGFEAFTPDHAGTASDLASLTRDPADLARAETALLAVASQPHDDPDIESYLWNQAGLIRQWQGNAQGSLEAFRRSVALIEANPLAAIAGRDTRRLNLANAELHYGDGPDVSEAIIRRVLGQDLAESGLNREIGRARAVLGEIALVRGQLDVAAREFAVGADIIERFAGPLSGDRVSALAGLVEADVRRGRLDAARIAQARLDAYDAETGARHPLGGISRALLAAATGDLARADAELGWVTAQPERLNTITVAPRRVRVAQARLAEAKRAAPAA